MKTHEYVIMEVACERARQMAVEGWTPEHDDTHRRAEMATAAACYAVPPWNRVTDARTGDDGWPWARQYDKRVKHDRRKQLVIAAALIVAEIERLDRQALRGAEIMSAET